ncbi:pentatricopeptide repeat-containing protein, partial [Tanacetum coccineum]
MNADGRFPDRIVFNSLTKGFCKSNRLVDALSLSHAMCKRGFAPSKIAYEYMLISLCASRLVTEALNIYEDMIAHNYLPSQYNCNWLLRMLLEENKLHEAHMIRNMMLEKGRKSPNPMRQRIIMMQCHDFYPNWTSLGVLVYMSIEDCALAIPVKADTVAMALTRLLFVYVSGYAQWYTLNRQAEGLPATWQPQLHQ